jgi:hypothetical protein
MLYCVLLILSDDGMIERGQLSKVKELKFVVSSFQFQTLTC